MDTLKIKPAAPPPDRKKRSFRLPEPTTVLFDTYLMAYEQIYGEKPNPDFVANEILMEFFTSDRQFLNFLKENRQTGVVIEGTGQNRTVKLVPPSPPLKEAKAGAANDSAGALTRETRMPEKAGTAPADAGA